MFGTDPHGVPIVWYAAIKSSYDWHLKIGPKMWEILKRDYQWKHTYGKCAQTKLPVEMHWPPQFGSKKTKIYHPFMSAKRIMYLSRDQIEEFILSRLGLTDKVDHAFAGSHIRTSGMTLDNLPSDIARRIQPDPKDGDIDELIEKFIIKNISEDRWDL